MKHAKETYSVIEIATVAKLKIYLISVCIGCWILLKQVFSWLIKPEKEISDSRDTPPSCLTNISVGSHSFVKLKGTKLHFVEAGDRDNPLLLLLHGFPDFWITWYNQIGVLSKHFRVVAVDLKGFGDSDKSVWRSHYTIKVLVKEIKELIHTLGESRCTLVGHDLGAHLGWYLASHYPDVLDKFVAISCPHPNVYWDLLPKSSPFNSRWVQFSQLPMLPESEALKCDLTIIDKCYQHLNIKNKDMIEAYKYSFSRYEDWIGPINYYRNLPFFRIQSHRIIKVPTLMIVGNKDSFIQLEGVVKSTEFASKFVLKIVENAGHFPHQEQPEIVNKLLLSFLTVPEPVPIEREPSKGLMNSLYGAVSNTVKYGNSIVDNVKKTTNDVVRYPTQILKHSS